MNRRVGIWALSLLVAAGPTWAESIWVEGESATKQVILKHGWYSNVKKEALSGGGVLTHWGKSEGKATYAIDVLRAGKYVLWLRANPVQAQLAVRVGDREWLQPDLKRQSHESINIASDNKPDLRFLAWVRAGVVDLKKGGAMAEVRFLSENNNHGMLDCFCLVEDPEWKPQGILKPGDRASHWPEPELAAHNLKEWIDFIRPSTEELGWRAVRWHRSLSEAAEEARRLGRPILLWAMNGHPCGET